MQRLVIPVNETAAAVWERTDPAQRAKIIGLFCWLLEKAEWQDSSPAAFSSLLDGISEQAVANGLTPEILEEILHES